MAYVFAFTGELSALIPSQLAVIAVAPIGVLLGRRALCRSGLVAWSALSAGLALSILTNTSSYPTSDGTTIQFATVHAAGVIAMTLCMSWAASNLNVHRLAQTLAVLLSPLIGYALILSIQGGGTAVRQVPLGLHPNWWGELAFAFVVSSLALRNSLRVTFIALALVLMVLVESRGALLATIVSLSIWCILHIKDVRLTWNRVSVLAILMAIGVAIVALNQDWIVLASAFAMDEILLLHDPYRGIGTGLTGRVDDWLYAVDVFASKLVFGNGFDTMSEVHNGFLRIASENGLALFLPLCIIIAVAIWSAFERREIFALAILLSYLAYAFTYPRMLNMNVAAALFYLTLFRSVRQISPLYFRQGARTCLPPHKHA